MCAVKYAKIFIFLLFFLDFKMLETFSKLTKKSRILFFIFLKKEWK